MINGNQISVLIDNCINSLSDTMQITMKEYDVLLGSKIHKFKVTGYERKPMPDDNQMWKRRELECLPTVARIARGGMIKCYTYSELTYEAWECPSSYPCNIIGELFIDIPFSTVDAAVERSFFFSNGASKDMSPDGMIRFCKWLLAPNVEMLAERLSNNERYPKFLLNNLLGVQRFRDLCNGLSEKQYPDAFHLWTAEVNDIQYFLTADRKFINAMTKSKRLDLSCEPLSPSVLLDTLKIHERDFFKYEENQFYNVFGKPE